jgi:hypothetical protein
MTASSATSPHRRLRQQLRDIEKDLPPRPLGCCPACNEAVDPDPGAVRLHSAWYHLRCALTERAAG